ncbi:sensor histidine kinase [Alkaliphilus crotonatoxidans]
MFFSIRNKLTVIYTLLILIPLVLVNYMAVQNMSRSVFNEVQVNTLKTANIIGNLSRDHINDLVYLKRITKQYGSSIEGRILIVNDQRSVLVDSYNLLDWETINNKEVREALDGQESLGYYERQEDILQVAVPIFRTIEGERQVVGIVLISTAVTDLYQQVRDFRRQLNLVSFTAALVGGLAAFIASSRMAAPIAALSKAAKRIGQGQLGETVQIKSKDELGRLADNFNQMSQELYRIDQGRTQFIGDVSHELKTPLASMKALIDSLLYGEDDLAIYREYLQDMDSEIDRLTSLIQSLLTMTKLEEQGIKVKEIDINLLLADTVKILRPLIQQTAVAVTIDLPQSVYVQCDPNRIQEVFINLMDNAIKYRDISKAHQIVRISHKINRDGLHLMIADNGVGISREDREAIFEKFYRSDVSRSRDTGGAGIGLSLVKRILDVHHWKISVESESGEGTIFSIHIPKGSFSLPS